MNKISNINIVTDAPNDSTSFYRAHGVFNQIRKKADFNIALFDDKQFGWNSVGKYDLIYLHRPNNAQHVEAAAIAKKNGVPLWIDFDDDIINIPPTNPAYRVFAPNKQYIKDVVNMADYVTVSTQALKDNFVSACQADAMVKFSIIAALTILPQRGTGILPKSVAKTTNVKYRAIASAKEIIQYSFIVQ